MKQNLIRIPVRFNLNKPEHAEIVSILRNLNKNYHTTQNSFIIEALSFYIRNMSSETLTNDGAEREGKRAKDYATHEYVDTRLKALEQALRLFVYEKMDTGGTGMTGGKLTAPAESKDTDEEVDLTKYDKIMNDLDQWTK